MSLDSVKSVNETTPQVVVHSSEALDQSVDDKTPKQHLALTLNQTYCDPNGDNSCKPLSQSLDPQKSDKSANQLQHKEEVKRRRTRRSKKRKWQRVGRHRKLQWSESTEQEVKHLHMKVVEHGQPLAPYNTTQFIMNEHNSEEIDFEAIHGKIGRMRRPTNHGLNDTNDDDFYSSPEDESDYLQQQFDEAYDNIHAERLSSMSKNELVEEYLQLEDRVEQLEKRLKESSSANSRTTSNSEVQTERCSPVDAHHSASLASTHTSHTTEDDQHFTQRVNVFEQQIKTLSEENQRLRCDNQRLECILSERDITTPSSPDH